MYKIFFLVKLIMLLVVLLYMYYRHILISANKQQILIIICANYTCSCLRSQSQHNDLIHYDLNTLGNSKSNPLNRARYWRLKYWLLLFIIIYLVLHYFIIILFILKILCLFKAVDTLAKTSKKSTRLF